MELGTHDKTIDGDLYRVTMLRAKQGRKLFLELKTMLGPSIAELLRGVKDEETASVMDVDLSSIAGAVGALAQDISPDAYQDIYDLFAKNTQVITGSEGEQRTFFLSDIPDHFQGRMLTEFKWMAYCLQVNYSDFLSGLESITSAIKGAVATAPHRLRSQATSTGISGESPPQSGIAPD